jgi:hypothetical protein
MQNGRYEGNSPSSGEQVNSLQAGSAKQVSNHIQNKDPSHCSV